MNTFLILVTYKTRPGVREEFLNKNREFEKTNIIINQKEINGKITIMPNEEQDGFFICKLQKK